MHGQDVMEGWLKWLLDNGVSKETADKMMRMGYPACLYLAEAVYGENDLTKTRSAQSATCPTTNYSP